MDEKTLTYPKANKLLKSILRISPDASLGIPYSAIALEMKVNKSYIIQHARYLEAIGLVKIDHSQEPYDTYLSATVEGLHYFDLSQARMLAFFRRSLLVPAIVSFITALLTKFLLG